MLVDKRAPTANKQHTVVRVYAETPIVPLQKGTSLPVRSRKGLMKERFGVLFAWLWTKESQAEWIGGIVSSSFTTQCTRVKDELNWFHE